jgi:hypothetical protein
VLSDPANVCSQRLGKLICACPKPGQIIEANKIESAQGLRNGPGIYMSANPSAKLRDTQ